MSVRNLIPKLAPPRPRGRRVRLEALDDRVVPAFDPLITYPVGQGPYAVAAADLTGDGHADLVSANNPGNSVSVLTGNGDGTFQAAQTFPTGTGPHSVATGDVTGDGTTDVVTANAGNLSVLAGTGSGALQPAQTVTLPTQLPPGYTGTDPLAQSPVSVATGDLNGDGTLDLVVGGQTVYTTTYTGYYGGTYYQYHYDGYINVLIGTGTGSFTSAYTTHVDTVPYALAVGDFNADTRTDVALDPGWVALVTVLPGAGNGTLGAPIDSPNPAGGGGADLMADVPATDFDGDGRLDLLARDSWSGGLVALKGAANGTFQPVGPPVTGTWGHSTAVGDINADGKMDVAVMTAHTTFASYGYYGGYDPTTHGTVLVLLGHGDGSFANPQATELVSYPGEYNLWFAGAVLHDLNADGDADLAATDYYHGLGVSDNTGGWVVPGALKVSDATLTEGDSGTTNMTFTVTLIPGGAQTVTVNYSTSPGSASAGGDYTTTTGSLTFGPGDTTKTITVPIVGDLIDEPNQTFTVFLSGAVGADLTDGHGVGSITDNDPAPTLRINDVSITEGHRGTKTLTFTVTLSAASENWVSVNFATANGTATVANNDYVATSGTMTIGPGQTTRTIAVTIKGDKKKEVHETFTMNLSGANNATILDAAGLGTILNDDGGNGNGNGP